MSEYCDIFPEDASCAVEETVEETTDFTPIDDGTINSEDTTGGDNEEIDVEGGDYKDEMK